MNTQDKKLFFILGAADPEINAIEAILKEKGYDYAYAMLLPGPQDKGYAQVPTKRVYSSSAYDVKALSKPLPCLKTHGLVFIECKLHYTDPDMIIDHHRPGDPGFGKSPSEYWEGSSIGQLCNLLGIKPTKEYRIIAAADHCLSAAYQGKCEGVEVKDLMEWRVKHRAAYQKITEKELMQNMMDAAEVIKAAKKVKIGTELIADFTYFPMPKEAAEGSIIAGIPIMTKMFDVNTKSFKFGIVSGKPETISTWMNETAKRLKLINVYGDPARGYAGGYRPYVKD